MTPPPAPDAKGTRWYHLAPLGLAFALAAWPVALWLVHRQDPVAAVHLADGVGEALAKGALGAALVGGGLLLLYPPAPAWLRLVAIRTWRNLTADQLPLTRALGELRHFESAARHLEVGRLLRQSRQLSAAAYHLRRAIELDPNIAGAHHQFGLGAFAAHEFEAAGLAFANAERLDPGHAFGDALLHLGRCQWLSAHAEAAATTLRAHQRQHGGSPKSHLWLADALLATGDRDGAREALGIAAARPAQRLDAEQNWFRARARVRLWRLGGAG